MTEPTLTQRVERLERANHRLKLGMLAVVAGLAAVVCLAATKPAAKVMRAERFEVVDSTGRARAVFGERSNGELGLAVFGKDGGVRAMLAVIADGSTELALRDQRGRVRAALSVWPDGTPRLALFDSEGKSRGVLGVGPGGNPALSLSDKRGKVLWNAP